MKNIVMAINKDGKTLTITVDLTKTFGPSASGKTVIVATTSGNVPVPDHEEIKIGINAYTK